MTFILDSSFLIWARQELPSKLDEILEKLARLTRAGIVTFPRQVRDELDRHDDELSEWMKRNWRNARRYDVDVTVAKGVISRVADVIDATKTHECADPWVVAQAVEFTQKEPDKSVTVVMNDFRDKAHKKSLRWACDQESVATIRPAEFLLMIDDLVSEAQGSQLFDPEDLE